jgi:uncharacterized membrane protein
MHKSTAILSKIGRLCYAVAMAGIGFQLFFYGDFHPVVFPAWPGIPARQLWVYITGALLIAAAVAIILEKKGRAVSLMLAGFFFALLCLGQVPYEFIIDPNSKHHLGLWTNALKELALSGGALVVAESFSKEKAGIEKMSSLITLLEKMIPAGPVFFSITMISFGIGHFMYIQFVSLLVPAGMPDPIFWTFFTAVALIGSGVAIILEIRIKAIGIALGTMILLWFVFLHVPRAIADPFGNMGNEITSACTALAFSGIAFVIACMHGRTKDDTD